MHCTARPWPTTPGAGRGAGAQSATMQAVEASVVETRRATDGHGRKRRSRWPPHKADERVSSGAPGAVNGGTQKMSALAGSAGYRSPCLSHAKRALYHLSYTPFDGVGSIQGRSRPSTSTDRRSIGKMLKRLRGVTVRVRRMWIVQVCPICVDMSENSRRLAAIDWTCSASRDVHRRLPIDDCRRRPIDVRRRP